MEGEKNYSVEITPEAENYYYEVLDYFYKYHNEESADKKRRELLELAISLRTNPFIGRIEESLQFLRKGHRYVLYFYTKIKAIKVIYFINESLKVIYITDFFPCESNELRIKNR